MNSTVLYPLIEQFRVPMYILAGISILFILILTIICSRKLISHTRPIDWTIANDTHDAKAEENE